MSWKWREKRRLEKQRKELRRRQLLEVQKYMKKIYNPLYYGVKPKHRGMQKRDEMISINLAVRSVYNPPTKTDYNEMIDIDRRART